MMFTAFCYSSKLFRAVCQHCTINRRDANFCKQVNFAQASRHAKSYSNFPTIGWASTFCLFSNNNLLGIMTKRAQIKLRSPMAVVVAIEGWPWNAAKNQKSSMARSWTSLPRPMRGEGQRVQLRLSLPDRLGRHCREERQNSFEQAQVSRSRSRNSSAAIDGTRANGNCALSKPVNERLHRIDEKRLATRTALTSRYLTFRID